MRNVDFTPLYRHAIGFDRLFNLVEASNTKTQAAGYPPYNIEQTDETTTVLLWQLLVSLKSV